MGMWLGNSSYAGTKANCKSISLIALSGGQGIQDHNRDTGNCPYNTPPKFPFFIPFDPAQFRVIS